MIRSVRFSRSLPLLLGALLVTGGLAACGSDDDEPAADEGRRLDSPVTIEHQFGTTTIDTVPERVVTLDLQWTDVMLAMGVEPVAYAVDSLMPESGVPWQEVPAGAKKLSLDDGVPVEEIIALDPDLVLGSWYIPDKETYDLLAAQVPTVAAPPDEKVVPWQELVRTAGEFLADPATAERIIDETESKISAVAAELPGLKDKSFLLAQYIVGDSMYIVADEEDGSSSFFQALGMKLYQPVLEEGRRTGQTRLNVSTERADLLRSDLLVFLVNGGDESNLADIPGFDQLPGTVAVFDYATIVGLNTPSPLSLPYSLEQLRPYLEKAAGGAGA